MIQELRRKTPRAETAQEAFPEPYLLTEAENALIDRMFELFNATGLTPLQAKELLRRVNVLIEVGERLAPRQHIDAAACRPSDGPSC